MRKTKLFLAFDKSNLLLNDNNYDFLAIDFFEREKFYALHSKIEDVIKALSSSLVFYYDPNLNLSNDFINLYQNKILRDKLSIIQSMNLKELNFLLSFMNNFNYNPYEADLLKLEANKLENNPRYFTLYNDCIKLIQVYNFIEKESLFMSY